MSETVDKAKAEILKSLFLSRFCMRRIGLSFIKPKNKSEYWKQKAMLTLSMVTISYHIFGDIVYISLILSNSPRFEDVVPILLTFGYGVLSISKVLVLWYKKDVFGQLLNELADIWPMPPLDENYQAIKDKSLTSLSLEHRCYYVLNLVGVWFYNITPIAVYFYRKFWTEEEASVGFVWKTWYPFDKHKPFGHVVAYVLEMFTEIMKRTPTSFRRTFLRISYVIFTNMIYRAQKPIAFTAMNFMDMNLVTYTAILTRSYSYFALLYTIYSDN